MSDLVHPIRAIIAAFLARCDIPYPVVPPKFDDDLYQACVEEATRRGYPTQGSHSVLAYLREGVTYASATCPHRIPTSRRRPIQIHVWVALYASCTFFVDDAMTRFPSELPDVYRFNERFVRAQAQGNGVQDALADLLRRVHEFYPPPASNLVVTSTMDFVTGSIVEHEIEAAQISTSAQAYAAFQRILSSASNAFTLLAFPSEIPVKDYIQALPEMTLFWRNINDVLSFYKEELAGETTNQISILAARDKTSKLDALNALAETTAEAYERAIDIVGTCPDACDTFKTFAVGLVRFYASSERYRLKDLELQSYIHPRVVAV